MRVPRTLAIVGPLALAVAVATAPTNAKPPTDGVVRIGMLSSMFKDINASVFNALAKPFHTMVHTQTGIKSELVLVPTPDELRAQMDNGKIQFGVFHGFEYAWMKEKQPLLRPVMVAAPQYRPIRAFLVVHDSNASTTVTDLKGKTLALPKGTREFSQLFLDRTCLALGQSPKAFFGQITAPKTAEDALHDVADNEDVQAAVVDGFALLCYTERNPARAKRIKVLASSEVFPPSVVAYKDGSVDAEVIRHFRDGMSTAHKTPAGRQLLSLWLLNGFEPMPADFSKALADIVKAYPPPDQLAK